MVEGYGVFLFLAPSFQFPVEFSSGYRPHFLSLFLLHTKASFYVHTELFCLHIKTYHFPEMCSQLLLIVAGDSHMPEHREHLKTLLSSADGRPPWSNVFTKHCSLPCGSNVHVQPLVWRVHGGETGLNIPCYRQHLSA